MGIALNACFVSARAIFQVISRLCRVAEYIPPRPVFARKPGGSKKVKKGKTVEFDPSSNLKNLKGLYSWRYFELFWPRAKLRLN